MIKKIPFLMLLGLLFSVVGVSAETIGFNSTITGTTISAPVVTSVDGVDVAIARGKQATGAGKSNILWGSGTKLTFAGTAERTKVGADKWNELRDDCWTGASLKIADGKKFTISDFTVNIAGNNNKWTYRVDIVNGDGTVVYTSTVEKSKEPKNKLQVTATKQNLSLTGTAYVKVYYGLTTGTSSDTKYFAVPSLSITGKLETSVQTNYTKPLITQGNYDRTSRSYTVALAVQNGEEGTINYTIGSGDKVSGVASGSTISVPVNTTIKATVSGDKYAESAEASLTTDDMPALATPTHSVEGYNFEQHTYTIALSATEGATIKYTVGGGTESVYNEPFTAEPGKEIKAYAVQENMNNSETLTFTTAAAPTDGSNTTPKNYAYTDGMIYDGDAYNIPNNPNYIAGKISSNNSSINGAIKMRISRVAHDKDFAEKKGFHIDVNKGYTITSVKLQMLNNYNTDISLTGIYVDNDAATNLLAEPVALPYASASSVAAAVAEVSNIAATDRIVFTFDKNSGSDEPNQAHVLISVTYTVPEYAAVNTTVGYATMYYEKELKAPADTKVYTARLDGSSLVLTELENGIIPASEAVIVSGNGGLFELTHTGATLNTRNDLKGTATAIETASVTNGTVCTLGYENNLAGFYKYTGTTLAANKAYIVVPTNSPASAKGINLVFDNNTTGINELTTTRNLSAPIYNIAGQRVDSHAKGLVIVDGKLVIKK